MQETTTIKEQTGWDSLFPPSPVAGKITLKVSDKGKNTAGVAPSPRSPPGGPGTSPSPGGDPPAAPGAGDPGAYRYTE